jgi:hypothetical protein
MHFGTKSYLKSTRNHTAKHALNLTYWDNMWAMAAPLTPRPKTNINIGSNMMFVTSPATIKLD